MRAIKGSADLRVSNRTILRLASATSWASSLCHTGSSPPAISGSARSAASAAYPASTDLGRESGTVADGTAVSGALLEGPLPGARSHPATNVPAHDVDTE